MIARDGLLPASWFETARRLSVNCACICRKKCCASLVTSRCPLQVRCGRSIFRRFRSRPGRGRHSGCASSMSYCSRSVWSNRPQGKSSATLPFQTPVLRWRLLVAQHGPFAGPGPVAAADRVMPSGGNFDRFRRRKCRRRGSVQRHARQHHARRIVAAQPQ